MCIQQTALDLLELGYDVHVIVDATSSRTDTDRMFALQVSTVECGPIINNFDVW